MRVWSIDLAEPGWSRLNPSVWLDRQERARAARFLRRQDASRFVAAHAAMRWLLARQRGCRPDEIAYRHNRWGKPRLAGGPEFSLTHSGDRALLALADQPVGVDIEIGTPPIDAAWFAPVWSKAEQRRGERLCLSKERLLAIWRRKEAVVKALGTGLSQPLADVVVPMETVIEPEGRWSLVRTPDGLHAFHCRELRLEQGIACIATRSPARLDVHISIPPGARAALLDNPGATGGDGRWAL